MAWNSCSAMPVETVPQAHDERADQLVGSVDRIKLRQLATPQPFHHLNWRHTPTAGVAILPRNRARTSWNGTGQR